MITVRAIGSCRLFTPMRMARGIYPFGLDMRRDFGFVHTSAEAIQALRFIRGEISFPDHLIPVIARDAETKGLVDEPVLEQPDIYLIEISSAKETRVGEYRCQLNYVVRHFGDFFADAARRQQFNRMSGRGNWRERQDWLETLRVYQAMDQQDRELLSAIEIRVLGVKDMIADLQQFAERTGGTPLVVQTHIAARDANGDLLKTRSRVMSEVKEAANALGLPLLDPSEEMQLFGQARALKRNGTDLTHFSDVFSEHIGSKIYEDYIRVLEVDGEGDDFHRARAARGELARLNAMIEEGRLLEVAKTVRKKLRENPHAPAYRRVLARVLVETFDFEGALAILDDLEPAGTISEAEAALRLKSLVGSGREGEALDYAARLVKNEYESPAILKTAVTLASKRDASFVQTVRKQMLRNGDIDLETANDLVEAGDPTEKLELALQVLAIHPSGYPAFAIVWNNASDHDDSDVLEDIARRAGDLPIAQSRELIDRMIRMGRDVHAAMLVPPDKGQDVLDIVTKKIAIKWGDAGSAAFEKGDYQNAAALIGGAFACYPELGATKRPRSAMRKDLRNRFRAAWANREYDVLFAICPHADRLRVELPERDRYEGLAAYRSNLPERAFAALSRAVQNDDVPKNAILSLIRTARRLRKIEGELFGLDRLVELFRDDEEAMAFFDEKCERSLRSAKRALLAARKHNTPAEAIGIFVALRRCRFIKVSAIEFLADYEVDLSAEFSAATSDRRIAILDAVFDDFTDDQPTGALVISALREGKIEPILKWLSRPATKIATEPSTLPIRLVSNGFS